MSQRYVLVGFLLAAVACGGGNGGGGDDEPGVDAAPDAPGPGCTAMSPRTTPPETFVGPTGLQQRLTTLIDGAQTSIDLQMYLFTMRPIADRLVAAKNRGVAVRVLLDPDHEGNANVRPTLMNGGVPTRNMSSIYSFAHAKFMIIDGARGVIMSANLNFDAMDTERNYGMITRDADDVADLEAVFDLDWATAGGQTPQPVDLSCTRLIVSPTNSKTRLLELINSAKDTLEVEVMYLSEMSIREAIGAAKMRGVNVRVILSERSDESVPYLRGLGIPVKFATGFYLHSKLLIADDVVFVGSENMSLTSLTKNREVGALVFEPAAAQVITTQFETDWSSAAQ